MLKGNSDLLGGRVKLLPAVVNKWGSDSNSGQFTFRRTIASHRNWTLTPIYAVTLVPMKPQSSLFDAADDDWRLHATARLAEDWVNPWSGQTVPKGSRLTVSSVIQLTKKKQLSIPLPNATALLLSSSARAYDAARKIREANEFDKSVRAEVRFQSDKDAFDYVERMIEAIVLAFTALEAFINESIPEDFIYSCHIQSKLVLEAANKSKIERYIRIDEKLTLVLPAVLKCTSPKGSRCWQGYKLLKQTRDRLIHMKTEDRKSSLADVDTLWKAVFLCPAPHLATKGVIDHFVKAMTTKPGWYSLVPFAKY